MRILLFLAILLHFQLSAFSQSLQIDSLSNLAKSAPNSAKITLNLQISKAYIGKNNDSIVFYADKALGYYKKAALEKIALENKLKEQELNEANFQLVAILLISTITVVFIIVFYFLRSKRVIAEREAQELQVEALQKRLLDLQFKNEESEIVINISEINKDLVSPLTELEFETLQLSLKGLPNSEIAEKLIVSINTVKFYLRNIYLKLGIKGKKEVFNYVAKSS